MPTKAEKYVHEEIIAGRLTPAHIVELVKTFQEMTFLERDGMPGPKTRAEIEKYMRRDTVSTPVLLSPMPVLPDGRKGIITSSFKPADRPNHVGVDFFYQFRQGDTPHFVGDKGCAGWQVAGNKRIPKWGVPYGTAAIAAATGKVQIAGNSPTGYRLWIDHGDGWRTGYFHLLSLTLSVGDTVFSGEPVGLIGDNPKDNDGRHLHFELSPVDRYAPVDPAPFIR